MQKLIFLNQPGSYGPGPVFAYQPPAYRPFYLLSPKKNKATVPGPEWAPMVGPIVFIIQSLIPNFSFHQIADIFRIFQCITMADEKAVIFIPKAPYLLFHHIHQTVQGFLPAADLPTATRCPSSST